MNSTEINIEKKYSLNDLIANGLFLIGSFIFLFNGLDKSQKIKNIGPNSINAINLFVFLIILYLTYNSYKRYSAVSNL